MVDLQQAEDRVGRFISDMFSWETKMTDGGQYGDFEPDSDSDENLRGTVGEFRELISRHCTGTILDRHCSYGFPPEHDPEKEKIVTSRLLCNDTAEVETRFQSGDKGEFYRIYVLRLQDAQWLIYDIFDVASAVPMEMGGILIPDFSGVQSGTPAPPLELERCIPHFSEFGSTAIRLHPRPGPTQLLESKLGGVFIDCESDQWPQCDEHHAAFVPMVQLLAEDFPELDFPDGKNVFQLTWCPFDHAAHGGPNVRVRWVDREKVSNTSLRHHHNRRPISRGGPRECRLSPERVTDYPDAWSLPPHLDQMVTDSEALQKLGEKVNRHYKDEDAALLAYEAYFGASPGIKVGGHPHWMIEQGYPKCRCGEMMEHLMTVSEREWDPNHRRWKPEMHGVKCDGNVSGIALDGPGAIYLFICRMCKAWPIGQMHQLL